MRHVITMLLVCCPLAGCATTHDPDFWAAMAGGAAAGAGNTRSTIQQSQQQMPQVVTPTSTQVHCTSTNFTPGVVQTDCF